jgi:hypothetical protein
MSGLALQKVVADRMQSTERSMPPKVFFRVAELTALLTWLGAGAAPEPVGCAVVDPADAPAGATARMSLARAFGHSAKSARRPESH